LIRQMMDRIGAGHRVLWVNVYLPKMPERQQAWNAALETVAEERPDEMFLYDWASLAAENEPWLARDQVHYSGTGYRQRSSAIAEALRDHTPTSPAHAALRPLRSWQPWLRSLVS
jgi:lysophospholipase L1-like esterase